MSASAKPPPPAWLDPAQWPPQGATGLWLFGVRADEPLRTFVAEHHVELGRLWRSLNRRNEAPAFGWYNCKPEERREAAFVALIRAALHFASAPARIDSEDYWHGYLVTHVERVNVGRVRTVKGDTDGRIERAKGDDAAHAKGVAALLVKRSLALYGRPPINLVRTLTKLTTRVQLSVEEVHWLARRAA